MTNIQCTRFKSLRNTKPEKIENLSTILQEIRMGTYQRQIEEIRSQSDPSKSPLKDKLPVFTPTGIFNYRSMAGLETYNGIMCLDVDGVENPEELKDICKKIDWVYSAFVTPSGKGLKVLVKTNATKENYREIELKLANHFMLLTGFERDNHAKDIARIQFISYDPQIWINENAEVFINPTIEN